MSNFITGYDSNAILINDITYPGPVVVTKDWVYMWDIEDL